MTADELRAWRTSLGMSQQAFGQWLVPPRTLQAVANWETGDTPVPKWVDTIKENYKPEPK